MLAQRPMLRELPFPPDRQGGRQRREETAKCVYESKESEDDKIYRVVKEERCWRTGVGWGGRRRRKRTKKNEACFILN